MKLSYSSIAYGILGGAAGATAGALLGQRFPSTVIEREVPRAGRFVGRQGARAGGYVRDQALHVRDQASSASRRVRARAAEVAERAQEAAERVRTEARKQAEKAQRDRRRVLFIGLGSLGAAAAAGAAVLALKRSHRAREAMRRGLAEEGLAETAAVVKDKELYPEPRS